MKYDLVTWVLNKDDTLDRNLSSVEKAIPAENIHCKIAVDGGSTDRTLEILKDHGFKVYRVTKDEPWPIHGPGEQAFIERIVKGIPIQANEALRHVDTEFYISTESDLEMNPDWFTKIPPLMLSDPRIAVVQGVELNWLSKPLQMDSLFRARHWKPKQIGVGYAGADNAMVRTEAIRQVGGYPEAWGWTFDGMLRERLNAAGWAYLCYLGCQSHHLKPSFWNYYRHGTKVASQCRKYWLGYNPSLFKSVRGFYMSFVRGGFEAVKMQYIPLLPFKVFEAWYGLCHYLFFKRKWDVFSEPNQATKEIIDSWNRLM